MVDIIEYNFDKITVLVQPFCGMVNYELDFTSRKLKPLAVPQWYGQMDEQMKALPKILHNMQGEWFCVPFGYSETAQFPHGYSANNTWEVRRKGDSVELFIEYPPDMDVESITKRITPSFHEGTFTINQAIHLKVRQDCDLPLGIHPCFRVSKKVFDTTMTPPDFNFGLTHSGLGENDTSIIRPLSEFSSLNQVPLSKNNATENFLHLPLTQKTEEVLQLCQVQQGKFYLENNEEKFSSCLKWNKEDFPSLLLWVSNGGRDYYPWNGENYNIGAEPVSSYFDLGTELSQADDNAINKRASQHITSTKLTKENPFITEYSFEFKEL